MRTFVILRGPRTSGRSTFIFQAGLSPWHVDQKSIEALTCEPIHVRDGTLRYDRKARGRARDRVMDVLTEKFRRGSLVLFEPVDTGSPSSRDAVSASDRTILAAIELARAWRYEIVFIDFCADIAAEEIEARLAKRPDPFNLHDRARAGRCLSHMRRRVGLREVPARWLTPADISAAGSLMALLEPQTVDIDRYANVVAIGDIHGCFHTLKALIGPDGPRDDVAYIFTGDYINKGPRSAQVLTYLLEHFEHRENAFFLAGNHEKALEDWVNAAPIRKKAFSSTTLPDFEARRFAKRDARRFLAMLKDGLRLSWNGTEILATHGGFARPPEWLCLLSAEHLAYGADDALFDVDGAWESGVISGAVPTSDRVIQVHGHRNNHSLPICAGAGSFNLEGGVESGGAMRAVILRKTAQGTHSATLEVPNCEAKGGRGTGQDARPAPADLFGPCEELRDTSLQEIV